MITRATAPGGLLAGTSQAIGKHLRDRTIAAGVAPEFMPKRNSELIGNRGRTGDDAARPEIGESRVSCLAVGTPCLYARRPIMVSGGLLACVLPRF